MVQQIKYKLQGNGQDSWEIKEFDEQGQLIFAYMVFENPEVLPIPSVDVIGLLKSLSEEQLNEIKQLINN